MGSWYPGAFGPECEGVLAFSGVFLRSRRTRRRQGCGATLVISTSNDSIRVWCHRAFARELGLDYRLLSDFHPRGGAARAYGVYRPRQGTSGRALFVIDAAGLIRWHYVAPLEVNPGVDGMLTALEALVAHAKAPT